MDEHHNEKNSEQSYDERLKGTFLSVILIGLFIILSWFGIFMFYWTTL